MSSTRHSIYLLVGICVLFVASVSGYVQYAGFKQRHLDSQSIARQGRTLLFGRAERRMAKANKDKGPKIIQGAGFGGATATQEEVADSTPSFVESGSANAMSGTVSAPMPANEKQYTSSDNPEQDLQDVFAKYGIEDTDPRAAAAAAAKKPGNAADGTGAFGEAVLAGIPTKLQGQIDNILISTTFFALSLVVLTGVGMSASALEIVFPGFKLDPTVNSLITDVLVPNFTPFFLFFFAVSITLGLFKYAQISSEGTVYKE